MSHPRVIRRNPPAINRRRKREHAATEWHALLAPVMRSPGNWFVITPPYETSRAAANAAFDLKWGRRLNIPDGRWDAVARENDLYVKFLGD